jgi:hypothetical protein
MSTRIPRTQPRLLARHLCAAGLLGGLLIAALPVQAQTANATVRGTITAAGAAAPAGTDVVAINKANGNTYRTKTLADGSYVLVGLSPGSYEVRVGGAATGSVVTLSVGQNATLDLASGGASATNQLGTVVIQGSAQRQGVIDSQVGTTVSNRMIEAIPQASRNFLSAADFAPGVRFDTDASGNTRLHRRRGPEKQHPARRRIRAGHQPGQPLPTGRDRRVPRADAELQGRVRPGVQRGDLGSHQIRWQ